MTYSMTQLKNMDDDELVRVLDDNREVSPIIELLCARLEAKVEGAQPQANHRVECPACMAQLEADYDVGNNMFTIKPLRD